MIDRILVDTHQASGRSNTQPFRQRRRAAQKTALPLAVLQEAGCTTLWS